MKTIRKGVFETNSSSSHSFTIKNAVSLVENNVLYMNRLKELSVFRGDDETLVCKDTYSKIALILASLLSMTTEDNIINPIFKRVKEAFNLDDIIFDGYYMHYHNEGEIFKWNDPEDYMYQLERLIPLCKDSNVEFVYTINEW